MDCVVVNSEWVFCPAREALVATSQVTKQIMAGNPDFFPIKPIDYGRFLVISVGTGSAKVE
ncbi:hypothetical protein H5410_024412 [Solanum commersonii]|uniref:Uncharacterized protein n=1 Tax=Solanum commersonii TaxID=4109 RepID=A0A9J5ZLW9_SOLCO|nr:hypothetical protein H5410_024412 [Solanum commersonii]